MKKLSDTKVETLQRAEDYLIEALDAGAQGAAKLLSPEDKFLDRDHIEAAHMSVQLAERALSVLHELHEYRKSRCP